jgi:tetratricopeptide (TPR) repeat protein
LAKARYSKRQGRFKEALSIIESALDRDPEFPDALYLKARILWEGFNNHEVTFSFFT